MFGSATSRKIGKGAYASIYASDNPKYVFKRYSINQGGDCPEIEYTLAREIAVLQLLDHPHVLRIEGEVKEVDLGDNNLCVEFVTKRYKTDLARYINNTRCRADMSQRRVVMAQLIHAVAYCHNHDLMHRDIKPDNILLNHLQEVVLCDFNLSSFALDSSGHMTPDMVTLWYRAPEVLLGLPYSSSVDMWSLGVVWLVLIAGSTNLAWFANSQMEILDNIFNLLGYPSLEDLPGAVLPEQHESRESLQLVTFLMEHNIEVEEANVIANLVCYPRTRWSAAQTLRSDFFSSCALVEQPIAAPRRSVPLQLSRIGLSRAVMLYIWRDMFVRELIDVNQFLSAWYLASKVPSSATTEGESRFWFLVCLLIMQKVVGHHNSDHTNHLQHRVAAMGYTLQHVLETERKIFAAVQYNVAPYFIIVRSAAIQPQTQHMVIALALTDNAMYIEDILYVKPKDFGKFVNSSCNHPRACQHLYREACVEV